MLRVTLLISSILLSSVSVADTPVTSKFDRKNSLSLSMYFDNAEGGDTSRRRIENLTRAIREQGCSLDSIALPPAQEAQREVSHNITPDILFSSLLKDYEHLEELRGYRKYLDIKVVNDLPVASSILVRTATAIHSLESLNNVRFAFAKPNSTLSHKAAIRLLQHKGVSIYPKNIISSGSDIASLTLVMHKDVFATAIASPLANKWASANGLTVIAQTEMFELGGLWIHTSVSKVLVANCLNAFQQLFQSAEIGLVGGNSKKARSRLVKSARKVFPAWIAGFKQR